MKKDITTNKNSYLSFVLGDEIFAISVHKVLEVLEMQKITKIPQTPDYVKGVINFRGEILPVIDTRKKFNMPDGEDMKKNVIIVLDLQIKDKSVILGSVVDGVRDVLDIREKDIKKVPEMGSKYNSEFIMGMAKYNEGFIMILDIDKVFSAEEIQLMTETKESIKEDFVEEAEDA